MEPKTNKLFEYWVVLVVIRRVHSGTVGCVVFVYPPLNQTGRRQDELGRRF
jgi:hypothetical protein